MFAPSSFPLYYELKLVGLIWLMAPQTKGAQLLYDTFINPFLTQHAAKFDPIFATTKLVSHSLFECFAQAWIDICNLLQNIPAIEWRVTGL